jgi:hypothetical protein
MAWKPGPLPPDTYGWGGVVPVGHADSGFFFADFCGDHVMITPSYGETTLAANQVAFYDNAIQDLPPCCKGNAGVRTAGAPPK